MRPEDVLLPTPSGVCCKSGGFHIDPTRPVEATEIWTFVRPRGGRWQVSAIQPA